MKRNKLWTKTGSVLLSAAISLSPIAAPLMSLPVHAEEMQSAENDQNPEGTTAVSAEDFKNVGAAGMKVEDNALILEPSGDHFAMLDSQTTPANDFFFEADINLLEGSNNEPDQMSAALVFGASSKKAPGAKWYGANMDTRRAGSDGMFRVFGAGRDILNGGDASDIDPSNPLHLAIDVKADGSFTYTFGNVGEEMHTAKGTIEAWSGGYVGLLTFNAKAAFSNISFEDRTVPAEDDVLTPGEGWESNLQTDEEIVVKGGAWAIGENGLSSDASGQGDTFLFSKAEGNDFVYETDLTFEDNTRAAGLIFRYSEGEYGKEGYVVNLDAISHRAKFWRWQEDQVLQLIDEVEVDPADTYHLKVTAIGGSILYTINGKIVANLGDHTLQIEDKGQSTIVTEGCFGLINWNSKAVFQNTIFTALDETNTPEVTDVTISSSTGTVGEKGQFFPESPTYIQFVKNNASTVLVAAEVSEGTEVSLEYKGQTYGLGDEIAIEEGNNIITMTLNKNGVERVYRLNAHRFGPDGEYYNEPYRGQYHYSVKEGWLNDPCGLVYYKGKYHMFHQYYPENYWAPMHWLHLTSTDLIHWEEETVSHYPDYNGTMFSGCMAVDENNVSGLFSTDEGGLIAYITSNGNGQRIKLAISEDEGTTWKKIDKIAADWKDDPLGSMDFRDPKVFKWENKWFMVIAGGPLRIYSSDDMVNWKPEAVYGDLHTECPDLYPQEIDGQIKWILSRGGRFYKVGDLKEVDGKWTFVPDAYYEDKDGVMNFGHDSYAAMSYYINSFGTAENPTIPEIITQNWMNTWDDYCRVVGEKVGQKFNDTYNLLLKVGLTKDENGIYRLTQTPIDQYEALRKEAVVDVKDVSVGSGNDLLADFKGDCYEIVSRFTPAAGTKKVGFKVRTGANGEETSVIYDVETDTISIDRSKSGIQVSGKFSETKSQNLSDMFSSARAARNADGSIDLHLYVDKASVEVFTNNNTVAGANQIFPTPTSLGASVVVEGEAAKADITIYPMDTIWKKDGEAAATIKSTDAASQILYTGKTKKLSAYIYPVENDQSMNWSSSDPSVASVDADGTVRALKAGIATITAQSVARPELSISFTVEVREDNFNTNVTGWIGDGDWLVNNDELSNIDHGNNHYTLSQDVYEGDWSLSTDVKYESGLVNIFFASGDTPFANQAYAVQLGRDASIKLFRFAGPEDPAVALPSALNDGKYHNIKIEKTGQTVSVLVDGAKVLERTYDGVDSHFNKGRVGLGLWDGEASFKNFLVTQPKKPSGSQGGNGSGSIAENKNALNALINEVKDIDHKNTNNITPESLKTFKEALAKANAVSAKGNASQSEVNNALDALNKAKAGLEQHIYRVYNPNNGEHLFTTDKNENDHLVSLGWKEEGVAWIAPYFGTALTRLYDANSGEHHYTADKNEIATLESLGWKNEGEKWNSASKENGVALHRLYNPNETRAGRHHYSLADNERDTLVNLGWNWENGEGALIYAARAAK